MQYILDSVVQSLVQDPERKFVYGEMVRSSCLHRTHTRQTQGRLTQQAAPSANRRCHSCGRSLIASTQRRFPFSRAHGTTAMCLTGLAVSDTQSCV